MKLFWLDLETTGLDPAKDTILELAIAETDLSMPFDVMSWSLIERVLHHDGTGLDPFIVDMHTKNGLLAECAKAAWTVEELERGLLSFVPEIADRDERPVLAGSTVHFDHTFLRVHMPRLAARFSHRHYDVSAVKLFCQSLGMPKPPKAEAHRAGADVLESVAHAKACREWLYENRRAQR